MKLKFLLCSFIAITLASALGHAHAAASNNSPINIIPKVIYGNDDRLDVFESSDSLMRELSRSTAAMISNNNLSLEGETYTLQSRTLADEGICKSERFSNQMAAASCSGFLISPDTMVTAGHCINSISDCQSSSWVFDFANITGEKMAYSFTKNQVFHCTKIISREKNASNMNDFAVVKLDRPVPGRVPLKYRTTGKVADGTVFTVIGHPTGLPLKITSAADMRDNSKAIYFTTNADTYGGNSGSAVVDSRTGLVEGILVRGDQDYTRPEGEDCQVSVHRDQNGGRGEDATRITNIKVNNSL
ncbi:MAG: serine protease [Bacteriovorax sp.]|nr:serine protease [Bacteriovorax sp.]